MGYRIVLGWGSLICRYERRPRCGILLPPLGPMDMTRLLLLAHRHFGYVHIGPHRPPKYADSRVFVQERPSCSRRLCWLLKTGFPCSGWLKMAQAKAATAQVQKRKW